MFKIFLEDHSIDIYNIFTINLSLYLLTFYKSFYYSFSQSIFCMWHTIKKLFNKVTSFLQKKKKKNHWNLYHTMLCFCSIQSKIEHLILFITKVSYEISLLKISIVLYTIKYNLHKLIFNCFWISFLIVLNFSLKILIKLKL